MSHMATQIRVLILCQKGARRRFTRIIVCVNKSIYDTYQRQPQRTLEELFVTTLYSFQDVYNTSLLINGIQTVTLLLNPVHAHHHRLSQHPFTITQ